MNHLKANFITTHAPLLQSPAQLLILPVSSDGTILDPVINRCKTLFPGNYQTYRRHCREGLLPAGSSLVHRRRLETSGLSVSSNRNSPSYLVNLAALDHPYHLVRKRWLSEALDDVSPKLYELIHYEGLRRIALLARPLIAKPRAQQTADKAALFAGSNVPILDWEQDILPLIKQKLQTLPKVTIDIHLPKSIDI